MYRVDDEHWGSLMIRTLALIAIGALLVAGCSSTPTASPASGARTALASNPAASPSPSQTPEASSTQRELLQFPRARCCRGMEIDAGEYQVPVHLGLDVSINVPPGWKTIREDEASVLALVRGENALGDVSDWLALFVLQGDGTVAAFQDAAVEMDGFEVVTEPSVVMMAGFDGWRVDLRAVPNPGFEGSPDSGIPPETQVVPVIQDTFTGGFAWTTASPEAWVTILTLRINDRDVVIYVEAPAATPASIDEAIDIIASLEAV